MWDWLFQFIDPLERAAIPYAVVGSVASSAYGEPRATNDLDLLLQIPPADAARLTRVFSADAFYVPPEETITEAFSRASGGHINVIALESMTKADLYPVDAWEAPWFAERRLLQVAGRPVWFARPEAVIIHKLRFFREGGSEKHLRDIRGMLAVSGDELDRPLLERTVTELGLGDAWSAAQAE